MTTALSSHKKLCSSYVCSAVSARDYRRRLSDLLGRLCQLAHSFLSLIPPWPSSLSLLRVPKRPSSAQVSRYPHLDASISPVFLLQLLFVSSFGPYSLQTHLTGRTEGIVVLVMIAITFRLVCGLFGWFICDAHPDQVENEVTFEGGYKVRDTLVAFRIPSSFTNRPCHAISPYLLSPSGFAAYVA